MVMMTDFLPLGKLQLTMEAQFGDLSFTGGLGRRLLEGVTLELCGIGKGVTRLSVWMG